MSTVMTDQRLEAWAYLSHVIEGPSRQLQELLSSGRDVEEIVAGIKNREPWLGALLNESASRYMWDGAARDLETISGLGGRLITPDHDEWPVRELETAFTFASCGLSEHARSYQADAVAPHCLWVIGENLSALTCQSVGIVGTRAATAYGVEATDTLVRGLLDHQWTVVSGGAFGIDAAAHNAALSAGGNTIAVAACGLDRRYPAAHKDLFQEIAGHGALVSEYPPGITPARHRFLTRNRLVAALTQGTVVVEASWRSGALNTLSWAEALGRVAMAVPGPITSVNSLGCHSRIRDGRAQLVVSADEVRALLEPLGAVDVDEQYELEFAASPVQQLSRNEMRIYDALGDTGATAEEISLSAGLTIALTVHLLVQLEGQGVIVRDGVCWKRAL